MGVHRSEQLPVTQFGGQNPPMLMRSGDFQHVVEKRRPIRLLNDVAGVFDEIQKAQLFCLIQLSVQMEVGRS